MSVVETPQYADLARSNPRSIVLQPLKPLQHEGFVKKPSSFLMLKVSLAEDPTGMRIAEWLKTHPPEGVTAVSVEALVLKARKLQGLVDHTAFPPGSTFGRLSESAQRELLDRLQSLDTVIHSADHSAQGSPLIAGNAAVSESLKAIDQSVNAVCKAVETPILLDPYFSDRAGLQQARDEIAKTAGTEEAISLRERLLSISATPDHLEIQRNALYFNSHTGESAASCRFRTGRLGDHTVLMEWFPYQDWDGDVDSDNLSPPEWEIERVERTTALLCQPKNDSFHILPCMDYLSEPLNRGFNLVFGRPGKGKEDVEPIALGQMYKMARIVPLGHRIQLAYELISTLENFHRVGWVHKNISSHNIMFLPQDPHSLPIPTSVRIEKLEDAARTDPDRVDLASPWLFGYEASRPDNSDSSLQEDYSLGNNIYHHPARWGKPSMSFTKAHDVYTLVSQQAIFDQPYHELIHRRVSFS